MGNLTKIQYKDFTCIRCGTWFGINISMDSAKRRVESRYAHICTACLKLNEKKDLIKIMAGDDD